MQKMYAKNEFEYFSKHASRLDESSASFLKRFNLSHLWVSRYYFDGFYQDLATDIKWKEKMMQQGWYNDFVDSFLADFAYVKGDTTTMLLWSSETKVSSPLLDQIKQDCNILSGFNHLVIREDYVENYGFASMMDINQLSKNMIQMNDSIYNFLGHIKSKTSPIFIDKTDLKGILNKPFTCIKKTIQPNDFDVPKKAILNGSYLTQKEIICLLLLKENLSYKEIAKHMNVSSRTVECFLYNSQKRLKLNSINNLLYVFKNDAILSNLKINQKIDIT